jgi:hypothetical protein
VQLLLFYCLDVIVKKNFKTWGILFVLTLAISNGVLARGGGGGGGGTNAGAPAGAGTGTGVPVKDGTGVGAPAGAGTGTVQPKSLQIR